VSYLLNTVPFTNNTCNTVVITNLTIYQLDYLKTVQCHWHAWWHSHEY